MVTRVATPRSPTVDEMSAAVATARTLRAKLEGVGISIAPFAR